MANDPGRIHDSLCEATEASDCSERVPEWEMSVRSMGQNSKRRRVLGTQRKDAIQDCARGVRRRMSALRCAESRSGPGDARRGRNTMMAGQIYEWTGRRCQYDFGAPKKFGSPTRTSRSEAGKCRRGGQLQNTHLRPPVTRVNAVPGNRVLQIATGRPCGRRRGGKGTKQE